MENQIQWDKLSEALANAQAEIKAPLKNREVNFTDKNGRRINYSYADLADVIEALKPMHKHGLSITHRMESGEFALMLITTLHHASGQFIETFYPLPDPITMRPQEFGSALTYGRRYSVSMITGIASEEDDDGAVAAPPTKLPPKAKPNVMPVTNITKPIEKPEEVPILVKITRFMNEKNISPEERKEIVKRVVGSDKKSTELSSDELDALWKYLQMKAGT